MKIGDTIRLKGYALGTNNWYISSVEDYEDRFGSQTQQITLQPIVDGEVQDVAIKLNTQTISLLVNHTPIANIGG